MGNDLVTFPPMFGIKIQVIAIIFLNALVTQVVSRELQKYSIRITLRSIRYSSIRRIFSFVEIVIWSWSICHFTIVQTFVAL